MWTQWKKCAEHSLGALVAEGFLAARNDINQNRPAAGGGYRVARGRSSIGSAVSPRVLGLVAAGIGGGLFVLAAGWSLMGHRTASSVPIVEADSRPLRVKPEHAGGMQVDGADESILSGAQEGAAKLAPGAEAPAPDALKAQGKIPPAAAETASVPAPTQAQANAAKLPAAPSPAAPPAQKATLTVPVPMVAATQAAKPANPAPSLIRPVTTGGQLVQLGTLPSEAAAQEEWKRLLLRQPDLLSGHVPVVIKAEKDGKTVYRLRTSGFSDSAQAGQFCDKMKAAGVSCLVLSL